jgi:hypothetical protein
MSGRECGAASVTSPAERVDSSTREVLWKGRRDCGFAAKEQQRKSALACSVHFGEEEGWACWESLPALDSLGQQLWREGEGSGLGAGGVPACATTAARDGMPEHAKTRRLTDHASSETIRSTPVDRLLVIAAESLLPGSASRCDCHHIAPNFFLAASRGASRRRN